MSFVDLKASVAKYVPLLLGALFMFSGISKVAHPGQAIYALTSLSWPTWLSEDAVVLCTITEIYLGFTLMFRVDLKASLIVATIVIFAFTVFLWYLTTLAHPPLCGCMGLTEAFSSSKHAALFGIIRNCGILVGLKIAYDHHAKVPSVVISNDAIRSDS